MKFYNTRHNDSEGSNNLLNICRKNRNTHSLTHTYTQAQKMQEHRRRCARRLFEAADRVRRAQIKCREQQQQQTLGQVCVCLCVSVKYCVADVNKQRQRPTARTGEKR
jgi:hypothetical protein